VTPSAQQGEPPGIRPEPSLRTPALKVLVAGAGAIGQWLGMRLLQTGQDVTLLARPEPAKAITEHGLRITGLTELHGHVRAVPSLASLAGESFAMAVLTCKAHQTAALGAEVAPLLGPGGVLLSLQNGLGNAEKLRRFVPAAQVVVGLTSHGVTVEAPGHLRHAGEGSTLVGPAPGSGSDGAARTAFRVLAQARLEPEWQDPIRGFVWRKAIVNAGINPVGALYGARNGDILRRDDLRGLCLGLVREAEALARRARVPLPPGDLAEATLATLERTAENKCSMLQDVERKRPTEVEQITGRLVRLGEKVLASMPLSDSVYGRVKDLEASYLGADVAARMARDELPWEQEPF
jgi:2-dehydropantoate 2-reductase